MSNSSHINELKKAIEELPESEVKSLLLQVLLRVNLVKETDYSEIRIYK